MLKQPKLTVPFIILTFLGITTLTLIFSTFKLFTSQSTDLYVKIKMSQGLWWSSTTKPSYWYTQAFKVGDQALDLLGKPIATIENLTYYSAGKELNPDQYNIYFDIKLSTKFSRKNNSYQYDRGQLAIGVPISIDFPQAQLTGTVIEITQNPLSTDLVEKNVILFKIKSSPWEFDSLIIGDKYFNGNENVFELTDKSLGNNYYYYLDPLDKLLYYELPSPNIVNLTITAKIKFKELNGQYFFGEDQLAAPGNSLSIITPNFDYSNFTITKIY